MVSPELRRELKLVLKKAAGAIVIHVAGDDGQPIAGATVAIQTSYPWGALAPRWGTTKADGTFTFSPTFPDRIYRATISAAGCAMIGTISNRMLGQIDLTVEPGRQVDSPAYTLHKTDSSIAGVIVDENGIPQPQATIVVNGGSTGSRSSKSDASGSFVVDHLVVGEQVSLTGTVSGVAQGTLSAVTGATDARVVVYPLAQRGGTRGGQAGGPAGPQP